MRDEIFIALKEVIKSRGMNYKELALELNMSESGLKKLMASKDCSMSKLDQICDILGMSFSDLVAISKDISDVNLVLNKKQEELFLKHPTHYHFFTELMANNYEWQKLMSIFQLSEKDCHSILRALDKVDLIEFGSGNRVRPLFKGTDISISAQLGEKVSFSIDRAFFDHAQSEFKAKKRTSHGGRGTLYLKKETLKEMLDAFNEVSHEFAKRSKREELLYGRDALEEVTHLTYVACGFRPFDHTFDSK